MPLGAITFVVVLFLVIIPPENRINKKHSLKDFVSRFDLIGTLIFIPTIVCLLLALQWGGVKYAWGQWRIILLLVLFSVMFVAWFASQHIQGAKATVPLTMLKQRSLASGLWFIFCYFSTFFLATYYVPIWFQAVRDISAYNSGINLLAMSAAMSVAVISSGFIVSCPSMETSSPTNYLTDRLPKLATMYRI